MKQIKVFKNPEELALANDFLATYPPESVSTITKSGFFYSQSLIVINYDDQQYPDSYKKAEIEELMLSNTKETMTSLISKGVMQLDLEDFEEKLESAKEELADAEAEVYQKEGEMKPEISKHDWEKAQAEKILKLKQRVTDLTNSVANIKNGIEKLEDSIARFGKKNQVMQKYLDENNL